MQPRCGTVQTAPPTWPKGKHTSIARFRSGRERRAHDFASRRIGARQACRRQSSIVCPGAMRALAALTDVCLGGIACYSAAAGLIAPALVAVVRCERSPHATAVMPRVHARASCAASRAEDVTGRGITCRRRLIPWQHDVPPTTRRVGDYVVCVDRQIHRICLHFTGYPRYPYCMTVCVGAVRSTSHRARLPKRP
jgi:hypothetical protein